MALSPAETTRTLHVARDLDARRQSTQACILAWTAWEGYNFRLLLCAVQMQGLTQARARDVLSRLRAHDSRTVRQIRRKLLVEHPSNLSSAGKYWRAIETDSHHRSFRGRRNGLVHGSASADPRILGRGVRLIDEAVSGEVLSEMTVRVRFGDEAGADEMVGRVLDGRRRSQGSRANTGAMTQVVEWLNN